MFPFLWTACLCLCSFFPIGFFVLYFLIFKCSYCNLNICTYLFNIMSMFSFSCLLPMISAHSAFVKLNSLILVRTNLSTFLSPYYCCLMILHEFLFKKFYVPYICLIMLNLMLSYFSPMELGDVFIVSRKMNQNMLLKFLFFSLYLTYFVWLKWIC